MYYPLLIIILNLVPPEAPEFSMQLATFELGGEEVPTKAIPFTKKGDAWVHSDNPEGKQIQVDGVKCIIKNNNGRKTFDLSKMLGVDDKPNWKELKGINSPELDKMLSGELERKLGIGGPLEIERKPDGVNFFLQRGQGKVLIGRAKWELGD
jgi:hypothetical protein